MHPRAYADERVIQTEVRKPSGIHQKLKEWNSSDPDVLFLIDGEVGVKVNHLWGSICWSGVSCDLHRSENRER